MKTKEQSKQGLVIYNVQNFHIPQNNIKQVELDASSINRDAPIAN